MIVRRVYTDTQHTSNYITLRLSQQAAIPITFPTGWHCHRSWHPKPTPNPLPSFFYPLLLRLYYPFFFIPDRVLVHIFSHLPDSLFEHQKKVYIGSLSMMNNPLSHIPRGLAASSRWRDDNISKTPNADLHSIQISEECRRQINYPRKSNFQPDFCGSTSW